MFVPRLYVSSVYDINLQRLKDRGIRAIVTDLDNTLVGWNEGEATAELIDWLSVVRGQGMNVCIVSNNRSDRVDQFARPLDIPFISAARKPRRRAFFQALELLHCSAPEAAMIGDQLFTDIAGGNRAGLYTILVTPINDREWTGTRIVRRFERIVMAYLRRRGLLRKEEP